VTSRATVSTGSCPSRRSRSRREPPSRQDVGMLQAGLGADLAEEALHAQRRAQLRVEHLEGDPAPMPEVLRQIHDRRRAPADLPLDQVPPVEGPGERGEVRLGHDPAWRASRASVPR
jgi:hypothetical protein